ncbi:MAG: FtsX-like permease family protein [Oryzihumus sp.]
MWAAMRYRRAQGLVIAGLAALITVCLCFAPLYERALDQALVRRALDRAPDSTTGLVLTSSTGRDTSRRMSVQELTALVPASLAQASRPPLASTTVRLDLGDDSMAGAPTGFLTTRTDICAHITVVSGRCPTARGEVAVTAADATLRSWHLGQRLLVTEVVPGVVGRDAPHKMLTVTGTYRQQPGEYWFGQLLGGRAGTSDPFTGQESLDTWVTAGATMTGDSPTAGGPGPDGRYIPSDGTTDPTKGWMAPANEVDLPLREPAVGADELPGVARAVTGVQAAALGNGKSVTARSGLPAIAADVATGRRQAAVIVPLLMAQLGMLALVVLWLVLVAAIEQRRPEVALARLRGRGPGGARRLLFGELGAMVLAGVPVGFVLAIGLSVLARQVWLVPGVPFELPVGAPLAALVAAVVSLLAVLLATRIATREPIVALLRRVPARRHGWALGVVDAAVLALAAAGVLALVSGNLSGPLALATPALLALAVGLLLAHVLVPVTAAAGRRALARGRVRRGLTALQIARRPAVRRVVTTITVATALVVFASDALVVGEQSRRARAMAEVGAPAVIDVLTGSVPAVRSALATVDPTGRLATPVVRVGTVGEGSTTTQAVVPDQFARIAQFPGQDAAALPWARLAAPAVAPLVLTGGQLHLTVAGESVATDPPGAPTDGLPLSQRLPRLGIQLVLADGSRSSLDLGPIPFGATAPHTVSAPVSCAKGCRLAAITVDAPASRYAVTAGSFVLGPLGVDGSTAPWGGDGTWLPGDNSSPGPDDITATADGSSLRVRYSDAASQEVALQHASTPVNMPALLAGSLPSGSDRGTFASPGLDGQARRMQVVGHVPLAPGGTPNTVLVNLDTLQREGGTLDSLATVQVWLARSDPAVVDRVSTALRHGGVQVEGVTTTDGVAGDYAGSASAWGLQLALVVGIAALLMAGLVVVVVVATSWRLRARDHAALRLVGLGRQDLRRVAVGEQVLVVVPAVLAGAVCGVAGAALALPIIPLFTTPPRLPLPPSGSSWPAVLAAAAVALVVLLVVAVRVGQGLSTRATLDRVREVL